MASNNIGSTALVIAAWFVAAFVALKYLPSILSGGARAAFGANGQGGPLSPAFGGYAPGLPFSQPIPIAQALQINDLTPDSAQALAELYNAANGVQPNGMPLTAGQQAALMPQYDAAAGAGSIPFQSVATLPDSDYNLFSAGDDPFGDPFPASPIIDYQPLDLDPDLYSIDETIPYVTEN